MVDVQRPKKSRTAFKTAKFVKNVFTLIVKIIFSLFWSIYEAIFGRKEESVQGEIVLITGGGNGIGKELSLLYAAHGATVVIWDIDGKNAEQTVQEIAQLKCPKAYFYSCDVADPDAVSSCALKTLNDVGDVTILLNNAGIGFARLLIKSTHQEIKKLMDVNIMSHFWILQAFLPTMVKNNKGHIVAISSMAGLSGSKKFSAYSASKFAVRGMMEALYQEYRGRFAIKFTTVCPFFVDTTLYTNHQNSYLKVFPLIHPKVAAEKIMEAQRKDFFEITIPAHMHYSQKLIKLLPIRAQDYIYDFFF